jgi:hypothetical protein
LPKLRQVRQFLTAAEQAPEKDFGFGNSVHESDGAIYAATVDKDGAWVYRSYLAKLPSDALLPEGTIVSILDSGNVGERALADVGDNEMVALHRDRSNSFTGAVEPDSAKIAASRAAIIRAVHTVPVGDLANALFNDRWQASIVTKPKIEDAQLSNQNADLGPSATTFDLIALIAGAFVLLAFMLSGFRLPPVGPWARSLAGAMRRSGCRATARLLQLTVLAREIRKPARPAPEVLASAAVQSFSRAVRRRSYADRSALIRSRRAVPPKEESHDLPLAA